MSFNILKLLLSFLWVTFLANSKTNEVIELQVYHRSSILRELSNKTSTTYQTFDWANTDANTDDYDEDYFPDYYDYAQYNGMQGKVIPAPNVEQRGAYYVRVVMGYPFVQPFYLHIDTGSAFTWLQCLPCVKCYQQIDPIFNRSRSVRFRKVYCDEEFCQKCDHVAMCHWETNRCIYETKYGDGSVSTGDIVVDTLRFFNSNVSIYQFIHGCGYNNTGTFRYSAGILGLGPGNSSLASQIQANGFSYCLAAPRKEDGSSLIFGSNLLLNLPSSITVPLIMTSGRPYYYIEMIGINIGWKLVPLPKSTFLYNKYKLSGVIVDTGATLTYFPEKAFNAITNEIATRMNWTSTKNIASFQACYISPDVVNINEIPSMTFNFRNGMNLEFSGDQFASPIQPNKVCLRFLKSPTSIQNTTIMGINLQQSMRLTFELSRSLLEFTQDQC